MLLYSVQKHYFLFKLEHNNYKNWVTMVDTNDSYNANYKYYITYFININSMSNVYKIRYCSCLNR